MLRVLKRHPIRYLSVCSGIEAATVVWEPLGWQAAGFAEIDKFPSAVLGHHYPQVRNFGDFTTIEASDVGAIDLLVGGTPCQSFSVAGLRGGLADDRGNLALEFLRLTDRTRPRWLAWENVPGVLSQDEGRAFGAILGGMVECGYGFAYRVLDAQYFGLAQRRKRVFVVGYLGDWRCAAAVLFERYGLSWNPPPRRKTRQDVAGTLGSRSTAGGGFGTDFDLSGGVIAAASLKAGGGKPGQGYPAVAVSLRGRDGGATAELSGEQTPALRASSGGGDKAHVMARSAVRRLTPRECERLQGFQDDWTAIPYRGKPAADGPRYKALGNSMAVPVMRWLGERIDAVRADLEQGA